jgi:hypothetical protein
LFTASTLNPTAPSFKLFAADALAIPIPITMNSAIATIRTSFMLVLLREIDKSERHQTAGKLNIAKKLKGARR